MTILEERFMRTVPESLAAICKRIDAICNSSACLPLVEFTEEGSGTRRIEQFESAKTNGSDTFLINGYAVDKDQYDTIVDRIRNHHHFIKAE